MTEPVDLGRVAARLARHIAVSIQPGRRPFVAALAGGQGAGKTTLSASVEAELHRIGVRACMCSLDDFYLTRAERKALAREVHPLLATRGVPGTHDIELLMDTLRDLGREQETTLPVFDKGMDDRLPRTEWRRVAGPLDAVVLEGWCLGARPQPPAALARPVNALEAEEDSAQVWRRHVNRALEGPYASLDDRLDLTIFLAVPDLAAVRRWRADQEMQLPPERRMTPAALERFIQHYERLTLWMLEDVPPRAGVTLQLGPQHQVVAFMSRSGDGL